jgi:stage II sporulation protein D
VREHSQHEGIVVDDKYGIGFWSHCNAIIQPLGSGGLRYDEMPRFPKLTRTDLAILVVSGLLLSACGPAAPRLSGRVDIGVPAKIRVRVAGAVASVRLEDYVLGAALSEVTPTGVEPRAATRVYEVQAVIARTYAVSHLGRHATEGFDVCDQTHCQVYQPERIKTSSFSASASDAVTRTAGQILRFGGQPAETLFHADCGGYTTTPTVAWNGPALPYLPASPDDVPGAGHRTWQFSATTDEWTTLLRSDPRTNPGGPVRSIRVVEGDVSGRAVVVEITGTTATQLRRVSGETLRTVITSVRGVRSFMSSRFAITRTATGFRVDGTGFGHGVGLCQIGAIARAKRGDSLVSILAHYYPGAR